MPHRASGDHIGSSRISTPFSLAVNDLIESVNHKRVGDTELLAELRKTLEMQVEEIMQTVEMVVKRAHDKHDAEDSALLNQLEENLAEIDILETELTGFKEDLSRFYQELTSHQFSLSTQPPAK